MRRPPRRLAELRSPRSFREDKVDVDALRRSLGDWVDPGPERFGLTWPGKAECMRVIQEPSIGTLVPMPDESVDWDTTQNVIIEGDNLEVLKLLQKAYYGKVKLIYIDPPYNTGKEFIYPDNFHEGLADYLRYSGPGRRGGVQALGQRRDRRPLPLQVAVDDVPAALPRSEPAARGRRHLRLDRRSRGSQPAGADERDLRRGELGHTKLQAWFRERLWVTPSKDHDHYTFM